MGGFLLKGGFGWGGTRLGLATQSVIGLDVVLADGSLVHASETENSDLYWAARGSGPGFFGVVICYYLKLYPRHRFSGMKIQVFRQRYLEDVFTWADRIGPEVSELVEFQILVTPKALGISSPGLEAFAPVLADSWREAREALSFIADSPIRAKASITTPLFPISIGMMRLALYAPLAANGENPPPSSVRRPMRNALETALPRISCWIRPTANSLSAIARLVSGWSLYWFPADRCWSPSKSSNPMLSSPPGCRARGGGGGIAEVLFGEYDFSGKLGFSWPRDASQTPINVGDPEYDPLYPYGFCLTY